MNATRASAVVAPETLDEATAVLAEAAARGDAVSFVGGGTELGLGYALKHVDLLVKTGALTKTVEYAPADMVVEVEAGRTLASLQAELAPHGQRLALDAPHPELATIGGLVATNAFGPRRTRFGSLRDLIVGVSLVRADGIRVRGGGKVVKNVAGFDLPKIAVGSLGTLGMIATATFRLHPLPETARTLRVAGCDASLVRRLTRETTARQLEPAALLATFDDGSYSFYAMFEGFALGVIEQAERFERLAAEFGATAEVLEDAALASTRDETIRTRGDVRVRLSVPPAALEELHRDALGPLLATFDDAKAVVYAAFGVAFVSGYLRDAAAAAATFARARASAEALGGNAVLIDARDAAFVERVDVYGTLPASFPLMRRLKDRFDPAHRFNAGRFLGGL
ncbi:MAG: FAD-binding oxidoreductase [Candidatus Eremiobacteraeota bacterium]|nr:FAD-binding oxidoreductase [Candidatus Eremiobacteraeota bacterium]